MRNVIVRVVQVAVVGALTLALVACGCPSPSQYDQIFLLNASASPAIPIAFDGGAPAPGATADGGADVPTASPDAGADVHVPPPAGPDGGADVAPDASSGGGAGTPGNGATGKPPSDCTPAAAGCAPAAQCQPACDCVFQRDGLRVGKTWSCTLVGGDGPAQVEARYEVAGFCGE